MDINDYLKDELKRLNRINSTLEDNINENVILNNEHKQIICNIKAMCEIAKIIHC